MQKPIHTIAAAVAALCMSAGIASAQVSTEVPKTAGEASTMGAHAQPNQAQMTDKATTRAEVRAETKAQVHTAANSPLPRGEASTTGPNGQPNMAPAGTAPESRMTTRAERRAEKNMNKAVKSADPVDYHHLAKRPEPTSHGSQGTPN